MGRFHDEDVRKKTIFISSLSASSKIACCGITFDLEVVPLVVNDSTSARYNCIMPRKLKASL